MTLQEAFWARAGGLTAEWKAVQRHRAALALAQLRAVAKALPRSAPPSVRKAGYDAGLLYVLRRAGAERDRVLRHPAFDNWASLWERHFHLPCREEDWRLFLGLFQGFAAHLALAGGDSRSFPAVLDPDGHFHLYGRPLWLDLGPGMAHQPVLVKAARGGLAIEGEGLKASFPREELASTAPPAVSRGGILLRASPTLSSSLAVEECGFLLTQGVTVHGLASLDAAGKCRFAQVLGQGLGEMARLEPEMHAEMTDMVRVLFPLENPREMGSVSSSYAHIRGAIYLSHAEDPLLQAETLIHEYCHQKLNLLLLVEPILMPGQGGQVFYSPWRDDPRRLRGLLLGAHAFLNVASFLSRALRGVEDPTRADSLMLNIARRLFQVECALRSASCYGSFTDFGGRFVLALWRELARLHHAARRFPPKVLEEAREASAKHREAFALGETGIHQAPDANASPDGRRGRSGSALDRAPEPQAPSRTGAA